LLAHRIALVDALEPLVARRITELGSDDQSEVGLCVRKVLAGELNEALQRSSDDDRFRGYTTVGPHRDDLELSLEGRDARRQASQGEQRSLALALRLAGHELVQQRRGVDPLLLLDDVFSELDPCEAIDSSGSCRPARRS
jgi:DNA replication and repair protein RecF